MSDPSVRPSMRLSICLHNKRIAQTRSQRHIPRFFMEKYGYEDQLTTQLGTCCICLTEPCGDAKQREGLCKAFSPTLAAG